MIHTHQGFLFFSTIQIFLVFIDNIDFGSFPLLLSFSPSTNMIIYYYINPKHWFLKEREKTDEWMQNIHYFELIKLKQQNDVSLWLTWFSGGKSPWNVFENWRGKFCCNVKIKERQVLNLALAEGKRIPEKKPSATDRQTDRHDRLSKGEFSFFLRFLLHIHW